MRREKRERRSEREQAVRAPWTWRAHRRGVHVPKGLSRARPRPCARPMSRAVPTIPLRRRAPGPRRYALLRLVLANAGLLLLVRHQP